MVTVHRGLARSARACVHPARARRTPRWCRVRLISLSLSLSPACSACLRLAGGLRTDHLSKIATAIPHRTLMCCSISLARPASGRFHPPSTPECTPTTNRRGFETCSHGRRRSSSLSIVRYVACAQGDVAPKMNKTCCSIDRGVPGWDAIDRVSSDPSQERPAPSLSVPASALADAGSLLFFFFYFFFWRLRVGCPLSSFMCGEALGCRRGAT